jgi:hypothetical protein
MPSKTVNSTWLVKRQQNLVLMEKKLRFLWSLPFRFKGRTPAFSSISLSWCYEHFSEYYALLPGCVRTPELKTITHY